MIEGGSLLDGLPDAVRRALADRLQPRSLQGGEVLMREGDEADGLYLLQAGRLRALVGDGEDRRVLGDIGRGEVVGEAALLTDQPRSATVVALRDSELFYLSIQSFEEVVAENPSFLRAVSAQVVTRMLARQSGELSSRPITTAAVVPLHATPLADDGATALAAAMAAGPGRTVVVRSQDRPVSDNARWVQALESENDLVVYRGEAGDDDATVAFLRQADVVVLVADADQRPDPTAAEAVLAAHRRKIDVPVELVLVHPAGRIEPRGTSNWLKDRDVRRHHHVHAGSDGDAARVARLLTNRGIGLVLSGGGARSMAEIGVVRAMGELGIPIDAVGGTSAGALVAGSVARGWPVEQVRAVLHDGMVAQGSPIDPTVPLTSLAAGRRMTERLRMAAGDVDIEDLWLPYYCVSTNLSHNRAEVHRRGRGWRAVRASMSIPGVFPPVAEGGDVLVDGGLIDNMPVGEMRRAHEGITVIAVDVGVKRGLSVGDLPESTVLHGWRLVFDRLHPGRRSPQVVGILTILARLTELGGSSRSTEMPDVLVRPDVERFAMLDFGRFDELVEQGHREALDTLGEWWGARAS
jgi:NTE family protein